QGVLPVDRIDRLAAVVAQFHVEAPVAPAEAPAGEAPLVQRQFSDNVADLAARLQVPSDRVLLRRLSSRLGSRSTALAPVLQRRKRDGFVRDCHGDLHLGNVALVDGEVTPFDRITFDESLRWIDVLSDLAFAAMDLQHRGRPDLAARLVNGYLERTGDYEGLPLLPLYIEYRAMVRAKVAAIRADQCAADGDTAAHDAALADCRAHLRLAAATAPLPPALVILHGLSGSGKSTQAAALAQALGGIRIRSDVERKRLHGLRAADRRGAHGALYSAEAGQRTYDRLAALAEASLAAGYDTIVDAAFLRFEQREPFRALAARRGAAFAILDVVASEPTLRRRVAARHAGGTDASDADLRVLERQLREREPLRAEESENTIACDTDDAAPAGGKRRQ
ncbi:MAG TPA: AAA family ATPase, partial [Burkholderiaceae bacterium]|nr:AAA family ATPase [Burkholderiaceae bacterium]